MSKILLYKYIFLTPKDNIIELKTRKLEHSKQMGMLDMNLKPDTESKNILTVKKTYLI